MNTAQTGARRERLVRDDLIAHGWQFVMRAAASKGPADLLMACPEQGAALVQVGSRTKTLSPADRERFLTAADLCHALPILAVVVPRQPIRYWLVAEGTASTWHEWRPA